MEPKVIGIISPCYNEEEVLPRTVLELKKLLNRLIQEKKISDDSFIGFVDAGSKDKTWRLIRNFGIEDTRIKGLKLSSNVGHQNALHAGLMHFLPNADALVSIDADLQDDIHVIQEMIRLFTDNNIQMVYGVRKERKTDSFLKKNTALLFYRIMKWMRVDIIHNHADFRLMSKKVIDALSQYSEVKLFLRGIIPTIGFSNAIVYYNRKERQAGESKYPLKKMISFAWDGMTSFTNYPLRIVTVLSFVVLLFCILASAYALISLYFKEVVPGWFSTVLPLYFLGGVQLFCLGIIGEYVGKIFMEVKNRPKYFIEESIN